MFTDEDIRQLGVRLLPKNIQPAAKRAYYWLRSSHRKARRTFQNPISKTDLIAQLRGTGVSKGDIICVYSSLAAIGHVEGGIQSIIESLCETVGEEGTVAMPAFAGSAAEIIERFKAGDMIDLRVEPSRTGLITEIFRCMNGVVRSSHPFASTCAWGAKGDFICRDHVLGERVCHKDSPYARIVQLDGKFIGLGTSIFPAGAFAVLEDNCECFPFESSAPPVVITYIDEKGERIERSLRYYNPELGETRIDHPGGSWIRRKLTQHLLRQGILRRFDFGHASSWIMDGRALYDEMEALASRGITIYLSKRSWSGSDFN